MRDTVAGHMRKTGHIAVYASAMVAYAFGIIISFFLHELIQGDAWLIALHMVGAGVFCWLWIQICSGTARLQSFGSVVLLSSAAYKLISAIDTAFNGIRLESWPDLLYVSNEQWWTIFKGETLTVIGFICIVASWHCIIVGKNVSVSFLALANASPNRVAWSIIYICGLALEVARRLIGLEFPGLEQLMLVFRLAGVAAIFGLISTVRSTVLRVGLAAAIGLPLSYLASGGGMKENIILPLLPAVYFAWTGWKSKFSRTSLIVVSFIAFSVLQIYVVVTRQLVWLEGQQLSAGEIVAVLLPEVDLTMLLGGVDQAASRLNLTNSHAWTMQIAENDGPLPEEVFGGLASIFIPRFFWPDKPLYQPGLNHTNRVFGYNESVRSATASGFVTELYLGGGLVSAILGSIALGIGVAMLQRLVSAVSTPLAIQVHNFALFLFAIRLDETAVVYAFSGPAIFVLFLLFTARLWNLLDGKSRSQRRKYAPMLFSRGRTH